MPFAPIHWVSVVPLPELVEACDAGPARSCEAFAASFHFELAAGLALGDRDDAVLSWGLSRADERLRTESVLGVRHWLTPRRWIEVGVGSIDEDDHDGARRGALFLLGAGESHDAPEATERAVRAKVERTGPETTVLVDVVAGPWARF